MKTKVPFTRRCVLLVTVILAVSCVIAWRLVELHVVDSGNRSRIAADELIEKERIPAQRGIIMDRHEEILTNNIQSSELVADRYHLREITAVVDGLAYNQVVHSEDWKKDEDPVRRRKILLRKRAELLDNATLKLSKEEKEKLRSQLDPKDAQAFRLMDYDRKVCEYYYQLHDRLVAEVLYPFLSHMEVSETTKDAKGKEVETTRFMTREDIVEKIAQSAVTAHNEAAEKTGAPKRTYRNQIVLARGLTQDTAEKIKAALSQARVRGIMVQSDLRRSYVMPELMGHVLGYVDHENKGKSGVEAFFQSYLAGVDGMREYRHNARGQILPNEDDRYLAPKHGLNLRLTIDMRLQTICEQELDKGMREFRATRGCMIVVEPQTGDILAMASRPSFNLNTKEVITHEGTFKRGAIRDQKGDVVTGDFNFACQTRYEPGSTFKVIGVTTALDKGIMGIDTPVNCSPFSVDGKTKPINDGRFNYGVITMGQVLKKSSNPGAARIALRCKWGNFKEYIKRFGLDKPIDIELPSGRACQLADGSNIVNFSRIAYGYSVSVSPLHMAMVYATIANNGVRMKPRLIDKIIAADGTVYDERPPVEVQRVMSERAARDLRGALFSVTQAKGPAGRGTATAAAIPGFRIGGKTGTAKKVKDGGGGYYEGVYTVSFAGILPIDDPRLVVMTVIDEPRPRNCNAGGGTVAAPIFRAAAERFINVLNIAPSEPEEYEKYLASKQENQATKP
ncbi:MAG: penicillin-binding protein 2 [Akkermansia sp.]|nr:penicillin-binding protein 2 [Akkermansia sp.]